MFMMKVGEEFILEMPVIIQLRYSYNIPTFQNSADEDTQNSSFVQVWIMVHTLNEKQITNF